MRVGGSAWDVNFDTKRDQAKKKKHFEYDCESRNEKKRQIWQEEVSNKSFQNDFN